MFFSGQLDIGHIHVQLGIEGLQATIIPIALILLGVLAITMPAHHVFYGVIALAVAVYSLVGVNLGGFLIGMVLSCVGGVLVTAWMPRRTAPTDDPLREGEEGASHEEVAR
jgi:membrane protein implicated in regulation of membrane protease activity